MPIIPLRPDIEDTIELLEDEDTTADTLALADPDDIPPVPELDLRGVA